MLVDIGVSLGVYAPDASSNTRAASAPVSYRCGMGVRGAVMAGMAKQLGHPSGVRGRLVGVALNRGNRRLVSAAVRALQPDEASAVVDVGFGGGVGLKLLLDSVGPSGRVHGVEVSETMLSQAARRYRRDIAAARLALQSGSMTQLPFTDEALDGAITVNTIYFVNSLDRAFTELARVIGSSGRIVIGLADPAAMRKCRGRSTAFTCPRSPMSSTRCAAPASQ